MDQQQVSVLYMEVSVKRELTVVAVAFDMFLSNLLLFSCFVMTIESVLYERELSHGWRVLKNLLISSLLLANRLNLPQSRPSLFLFGLLSPLWCFSTLVNYYFEISFDLRIFCASEEIRTTYIVT